MTFGSKMKYQMEPTFRSQFDHDGHFRLPKMNILTCALYILVGSQNILGVFSQERRGEGSRRGDGEDRNIFREQNRGDRSGTRDGGRDGPRRDENGDLPGVPFEATCINQGELYEGDSICSLLQNLPRSHPLLFNNPQETLHKGHSLYLPPGNTSCVATFPSIQTVQGQVKCLLLICMIRFSLLMFMTKMHSV